MVPMIVVCPQYIYTLFTSPYTQFIYMICSCLNLRFHGCIPIPFPSSYTTFGNNRCAIYLFIFKTIKSLVNRKIDTPISIANIVQMKHINM
jgi:hypothetical protein